MGHARLGMNDDAGAEKEAPDTESSLGAGDEPTEPVDPATPSRVSDHHPFRSGFVAFLAYLGASTLIYALPIWSRFSQVFAGEGGGDAFTFTWSLRWWPFALSHGLDPLHSNFIWAPQGISMTWVTSIPGPAIVLAPVTHLFGPVVAENVITVLGPALAGWATYLLCKRVTGGSRLPAFAVGYLFGFSTYMVAQERGHPNLFLVFPVPLGLYLVVRWVEGSMGPVRFVALMALTLTGLFSISTEVFASTAFFGAVALVGAFALASGKRARLVGAGALILGAYALTALAVWPFLRSAIANAPAVARRPVIYGASSVDALSFVIPRWATFVGGQHYLATTRPWQANISEDGAYLSPAVIAIVLLALATRAWRDRAVLGAFLFASFAAAASLGAYVHVDNVRGARSLWYPFAHVSVLQDALPQRFTMFMWIGIAVIVARWIVAGRRRWWRYCLVVLAGLLLFPNIWMPGLNTSAAAPAFFVDGTYRTYLTRNSTVLLVNGGKGEEMRWQELTNFWFAMPQAHFGSTPAEFANDPAYGHIRHFRAHGVRPEDLLAFVRAHQVTAVVVGGDVAAEWKSVVSQALGVEPLSVGGIDLYRPAGGASGF